jgi:hypothetical protein
MSGMENGSKGLNCKIYSRKVVVNRPAKRSIDYLEKFLTQPGEILLKWAIVKVENFNFIVNATYLVYED